jgi:hypothetical protein
MSMFDARTHLEREPAMSHLNRSSSWPAAALAAAEKAFTLLCTPPAPLIFDTRTIGHGLPAGMVPLDQLRTLLLDPGTCDAARWL